MISFNFNARVGASAPSVDNLHITAGDIALSFNDVETYTIIRDAGIRAGSFVLKRDVFPRLMIPRAPSLPSFLS